MTFFFTPKPEKKVKKRKKTVKLEWEVDHAIKNEMKEIVDALEMSHINPRRVFCYRTTGSKARAYARIWSFPKIFQTTLEIDPAYVLEIITEKFERLNPEDRKKVIIHELLHIPKNFSGSLLPHKYGNTRIDSEVNTLFDRYKNSVK